MNLSPKQTRVVMRIIFAPLFAVAFILDYTVLLPWTIERKRVKK